MESTENADAPSTPLWLRLIVGRRPLVTLLRALVLVLVSVLVFRFWLLPIRVTGTSMVPTYHDRQVNFINRLAYFHSHPKRGDIVCVRLSQQQLLLLKRVVGLPGERVAIRQGVVYINGDQIEEPYANGKVPGRVAEFELKTSEYFVIGDNRPVSDLLRRDEQDILGKVIY